jgi:DNA-binding HxlR family transcriptional regulator
MGAHNRLVAGYGQFCPVARASELFAERWTPLILREIMHDRHHFNEIHRGLHRISPTLLGERLRRLERAHIIETRPNPSGRGSTYYLKPAGLQLAEVVKALGVWGQQWLEVGREHLDPDVLMWRIYMGLSPDSLPGRRQVVRFDFSRERKSYWLVLRRPDPDLCYTDPGFGEDVVVHADLEALVRVYLGQTDLASARRAGLVEIDGPREAVTAVARWLPRSGFAAHARPVRYDRSTRAFVSSGA